MKKNKQIHIFLILLLINISNSFNYPSLSSKERSFINKKNALIGTSLGLFAIAAIYGYKNDWFKKNSSSTTSTSSTNSEEINEYNEVLLSIEDYEISQEDVKKDFKQIAANKINEFIKKYLKSPNRSYLINKLNELNKPNQIPDTNPNPATATTSKTFEKTSPAPNPNSAQKNNKENYNKFINDIKGKEDANANQTTLDFLTKLLEDNRSPDAKIEDKLSPDAEIHVEQSIEHIKGLMEKEKMQDLNKNFEEFIEKLKTEIPNLEFEILIPDEKKDNSKNLIKEIKYTENIKDLTESDIDDATISTTINEQIPDKLNKLKEDLFLFGTKINKDNPDKETTTPLDELNDGNKTLFTNAKKIIYTLKYNLDSTTEQIKGYNNKTTLNVAIKKTLSSKPQYTDKKDKKKITMPGSNHYKYHELIKNFETQLNATS